MVSELLWFWHQVRNYRLQAVINIFLGLALVATDLSYIYVSKAIIDTATGASDQYDIYVLAAAIVFMMCLQITLRISHRWVIAVLGVRAQNLLQQRMFARVLNSVWRGRERLHTGDIVNRLESDVRTVVEMATERIPMLTVVFVRLIGAFCFLFVLQPSLAVAVVIALPLFIGLSRLYFMRMREMSREVRRTDSRVQSLMQEFIQHQLVVKTLERVDGAVNRLERLHNRLRGQIVTRTRFSSFSSAIFSAGFSGVYIMAFLWGVFQLRDNAITYGTMIAFIQLVVQIQQPFSEMTRFIPQLISAFTSTERLMELDKMEQDDNDDADFDADSDLDSDLDSDFDADDNSINRLIDSSTTPELKNSKTQKLKNSSPTGVRFTNVTYGYSEHQRLVLQDASFVFTPGTFNVVLGPTGAGKTTIIRLILALIRPQQGRVELYNADGAVTASVATRRNIIYVPQGNTLISGTIRDNLLLGCEQATEDDFRWAINMACAEFVYDLPDGLDTVTGEMGLGLSEGQAQRIAFARSLLHGGNVMLLDEATSALDVDTERRLLTNIKTLAHEGRTIIFITHRRAVLTYCDNVVDLTA